MISFPTSVSHTGAHFTRQIFSCLRLTAILLCATITITAQAQQPLPGALNDVPTDKPVVRGGSKTEDTADKKESVADRSTADMARMVAAMEERIRQLEEKLMKLEAARSATPDEAPALAQQTAEIKKEVETLKEEAKSNSGFASFFRNVELSGVADVYYNYNFNKVSNQARPFDVRHNSFTLNQARLAFEKQNSKDDPVGFRIDFGFGEMVDRIISAQDSGEADATKHIMQAYVSYVAPVGNGWKFDFGKFATPIGAEPTETKDNFNYSRSFLFAYGPFYHAGLRTSYAINDKVAVTGFLLNGWDNLFDNNGSKTGGFSASLTPNGSFSLTQTYLAGPETEPVSGKDNWRHIADTVATVQVNPRLKLMGNFAYGSDADALGNRGHWSGFAGYLRYAFNDRWAFAPRFEVFNDPDALRTGLAQTLKGITLTQELKLANNLIGRFEFRRDYSNQPFFTNSTERAVKDQNTLLLGLSYFFTTKGQ